MGKWKQMDLNRFVSSRSAPGSSVDIVAVEVDAHAETETVENEGNGFKGKAKTTRAPVGSGAAAGQSGVQVPASASCSSSDTVPTHHNRRQKPETEAEAKAARTKVFYACPNCNLIFRYLNHFMRHLKTRPRSNQNEPAYSSEIILASMTSEDELKLKRRLQREKVPKFSSSNVPNQSNESVSSEGGGLSDQDTASLEPEPEQVTEETSENQAETDKTQDPQSFFGESVEDPTPDSDTEAMSTSTSESGSAIAMEVDKSISSPAPASSPMHFSSEDSTITNGSASSSLATVLATDVTRKPKQKKKGRRNNSQLQLKAKKARAAAAQAQADRSKVYNMRKQQSHTCPYCNKTFIHWGHFDGHLSSCEILTRRKRRELRRQGMGSSLPAPPPVRPESPEYKCAECQEVFIRYTSFAIHVRMHQRFQVTSPTCPICKKTFKSIAATVGHIQFHYHRKKYRCKHCSKEYKYLPAWTHHVKSGYCRALQNNE